jgi:hypothetical protein
MAQTDQNVCKQKPVGIVKEDTYVAPTSLGNDVKADDLGVWTHKGKPIRKYKIVCSESRIIYG